MEENIVPEMRVSVQLGVATICRSATLRVTSEDVNETMLDLLGHSGQVHVLHRRDISMAVESIGRENSHLHFQSGIR
jgi:hypothetical protein